MTNRKFTNFDNFLGIKYIRRVESIYMSPNDFDLMKNNFENIYQENTKLKAEIEELKEEVNVNKCWSDVVERTLKKEIDKNLELKSELEQSIKLPCKVGDVVYDNDFGKPTPSVIVGYSFGNIFQDDYWKIDEEQIYFYSKSNRFNIDMVFPVSEIGKSIFLSQEEAEQSLKAAQP